jgi:hypothetical protein
MKPGRVRLSVRQSAVALLLAAFVVALAGCPTGSTGLSAGSASTSSAKAITAFGFMSPAALGTVTEANHTIAVTVPFGTNVTALVASFTTTGASIKVGSTVQTSGTTANNFTSPVTYVVTAADSSTQNYIVTVTVQAPSTNALLNNVVLVDSLSTTYSLVPTFSSTTLSYTGVSPSLPSSLVTATLTLTPQDPTATITSVTETDGLGSGGPVVDGHAGNVYGMALIYFRTIVTIVVTAQDGVTTKTYVINFIRVPWRG